LIRLIATIPTKSEGGQRAPVLELFSFLPGLIVATLLKIKQGLRELAVVV